MKFSDKTALKLSILALLAVFFSTTSQADDQALNQLEFGLNSLVTHLARSVVTVEASHPVISDQAGQTPEDAIYSMVSTGIIYDSLGHVLTMASSIAGKSAVVIRFEDQTCPAVIQAIDYQTGLALLRCDRKIGVPARLNGHFKCCGQLVMALGSAYGLRATPSMGFCAGIRPDGIMQFTAPLPSGTLGGGLFDLSGDLVGLINGGIGAYTGTGVGLAIPAGDLPEVVQYLQVHGDRPAGYLGMTTDDIEITPPIEIRFTGVDMQLPGAGDGLLRVDKGILINRIVPNSPAAHSGLREQDVMFAVGEHRIYSVLELADIVRHTAPGALLTFGIIRQNSPYYIQVRIGESRSFRPLPDTAPFSSDQPTLDGSVSTDSLLHVINQMQLQIQMLERRVKQLE